MAALDLLLLVIVYAQPPFVGYLLATSLRPGLIDNVWWARRLGLRQRQKSTRFFECAAYSRLSGWVRYGTQCLALCSLFLLYDVDLVFFFTEVTAYEQWTAIHYCLFGAYLGFFALGLLYDYWRFGFTWSA